MGQHVKENETKITRQDVEHFINTHRWIFAKTYAAFCPHEYVVMMYLSPKDKEMFFEITKYIRYNGIDAQYGKCGLNQYLIVGENYYWTTGNGPNVENMYILNRAKLSDYELIERLDGAKIWKRRKK